MNADQTEDGVEIRSREPSRILTLSLPADLRSSAFICGPTAWKPHVRRPAAVLQPRAVVPAAERGPVRRGPPEGGGPAPARPRRQRRPPRRTAAAGVRLPDGAGAAQARRRVPRGHAGAARGAVPALPRPGA